MLSRSIICVTRIRPVRHTVCHGIRVSPLCLNLVLGPRHARRLSAMTDQQQSHPLEVCLKAIVVMASD